MLESTSSALSVTVKRAATSVALRPLMVPAPWAVPLTLTVFHPLTSSPMVVVPSTSNGNSPGNCPRRSHAAAAASEGVASPLTE